MRAHDAPKCRVAESIKPSDIGPAFRHPDRRCKMHLQSIHIAAHSRPNSAVHWRARRGWMNAIRLGADLSTLAMAYEAARLEPDGTVESLFERSSLGANAIALVRFRFARLTSTIAVPTFRTWKRNELRRSAMSVAEVACATGRVVLIVSPDAVILQPRLRNATRILRSMRPPGQAAGEAHSGSTLAAMRGFFDAARRAAPCVALIDELNSFGDRRLFDARHRQHSTQIGNGLLECLDGDGRRDGVLIAGTTNDPERIDAAIVRSGRFDRCISIPLPSISDIAAILRHHLGKDLADVELGDIARRAAGCTGADCAARVRQARGRARRSNRALRSVDLSSEMNSLEEVSGRSDDRRAAVHEGGHAIVAHALGFQVRSVAINRISSTGGATWLQDLGPYPTEGTFHDLLVVHLAGRPAEVLVLGCPSIGSATDLAAATEICSRMHCSWGLAGSILVRRHDVLSDELTASIRRDLDRAYAAARTIVEVHRVALDMLIRKLVERRALDQLELDSFIGHLIPFDRSRDMHVYDRCRLDCTIVRGRDPQMPTWMEDEIYPEVLASGCVRTKRPGQDDGDRFRM